MKRSVFLLILTAGALSLVFGIIMPVIIISYRKRLQRTERDLANAEMQLRNSNSQAPRTRTAPLNPAAQQQIQADPDLAAAEKSYRLAVASAQNLLERDPYRAGIILRDVDQCPGELRDFGWRWTAKQLPQFDKILYKHNAHAAVLSDDGKTLAVQIGDNAEPKEIVVVDLVPGKRPPFVLPEASLNFALAPDGSRLAIFKGGKIAVYTVAEQARPPVELPDAGPEIGFTADGSMIVSASTVDGHLVRWQADSGKEVSRFDVRGDWMRLTPDCSALVAVTFAMEGPGKMTRYDVATGMTAMTVPLGLKRENIALALEKVAQKQTPYALSDDGTKLATVRMRDRETRLEMWDLKKGKLSWAKELPPLGRTQLALCLAFSPDGKSLASVGGLAEMRLWDVGTGAGHKWFPVGPSGSPEFLVWQRDGKALIVDTQLGPTRWFPGIAADRLVWTTPEAGGGIQALSPDGRFLAATNLDGAVILQDLIARRTVATFDATDAYVLKLQFSPNCRELAVVRDDNTLSLIATATGKSQLELQARGKEISDIAFSTPDGKALLTLDKGGTVRGWERATGKALDLEATYPKPALSPNGRLVAYLKNGGTTLVVEDVLKQKEVARFEENLPFVSVGFFGDPDMVIAFDASGRFSTWDPETQTRLVDASAQLAQADVLEPPDFGIHVCSWTVSGDRKTVACLGNFGGVRVCDLDTGNVRFTRQSLAVANQGQRLIDNLGREVRFPDTLSGNRIDRFQLSYDGRMLLVVGVEAPETRPFCQILDGLTGDEISPVPLPAGPLQDVLMSDDGSTLAVARPKGPITIWKIR